MSYNLRNQRPSTLHIPDARLRLGPGQRVTVAALSPQLTHLVAIGALVMEPAVLEPRPTPVPLEVPVVPVEQTVTRQTEPDHRNAAAVLPPRLLARVQRVITGYVTIPPPVTAADARRQQLVALQHQGATSREIAAAFQMSRRHVNRLLRAMAAAEMPSAPAHPLPAPLLAQVQRYVTGRLYVPAVTTATRRRLRLHQAFAAGESTGEIARRMRCSARHVRRERARWRDSQARAGEDQAHDGLSADRQHLR